MNDHFFPSILMTIILIISAPLFLSLISSLAAILYFGSMTKINVVDKKYDGKWSNFFKSWFRYFKKKL